MGASTSSTIIPCVRYRDAPATIDGLCDTFGFGLHDKDHGKRGYSCRVPEGYLWNCDSFNPCVLAETM